MNKKIKEIKVDNNDYKKIIENIYNSKIIFESFENSN